MNLRESVARAIDNCPEWPAKTYHYRQADAAILAMFNHLAANVSEGMSQAGFDNNTYRWADEAFRAMIEQARKEYEETKG